MYLSHLFILSALWSRNNYHSDITDEKRRLAEFNLLAQVHTARRYGDCTYMTILIMTVIAN